MDTGFGSGGKVVTPIGTADERGFAVAIQPDGKIVVAGQAFSDFAVVRYFSNGALDTTFGGTGKVTTPVGTSTDTVRSVAIQSDGKIVVGGTAVEPGAPAPTYFALVRYTPAGALDATFNGTGKVITRVTEAGTSADTLNGLVLQSDGKIVAAGTAYNGNNSDIAVVRYNTNGSLDSTFGGTGKILTDIGLVINAHDYCQGVALQPDGKIVAVGRTYNGANDDYAIVRYNLSGTLDSSFNGSGKRVTAFGTGSDIAYSVTSQADGRIVVAGIASSSSIFGLAVYNPDGSLDSAFGSQGKVTTASVNGTPKMALQSDGKIVVAGGSSDFLVIRYIGTLGPDTDGDGIPDIYETGTGTYVSPTDTGTNPNIADTDGDGFADGFEVTTGFSPTSAASTPDAVSTILQAVEYRFNAAPGISYRVESSTDLSNWATVETPIIGNGGVVTRFYSIQGQLYRYFRARRN